MPARTFRGWRGWVALALILGALAGFPPAAADLLQDLGATYQKMAEELARAFPKVEGKITAADDTEAIELTGTDVGQLRPGLEVTVFRKGQPFRHPITNQLLGQSEVEVAALALVGVTGDTARGRVVWAAANQRITVGDGVRLSAGRLPVAVLPTEGVHTPFESVDQTALLLATRFAAILEKTGRFVAVDPQRVLGLPARSDQGTALTPLEAARRLNAPAVLSSRVVLEGRARHLEATWWSGRSGAQMVNIRQPLVRATFPPRFVWEQTPELERRLILDGSARALAAADLDGDGRTELMVADEDVVTLYRWQEGPGLVPVAGGSLRSGGAVLAADAADVVGNGRAQLVMTDYSGAGRDAIRSRVFGWEDGQFRVLYETTRRFLRAVPVGTEHWLIEQDADDPEPFTGPMRRLVWKDGRFQDGAAIRAPRGVSVYGLALLRLTGSPDPEVVAITGEDRLVVWSAKGQRLWTSGEPMGGATVAFPYYVEGRSQGALDAVIGRVAPRVIGLPGTAAEILVYENLLPALDQARTLLPRLAPIAFTSGRVHRLRWRDGGFLKVWQSTPTTGYIADLTYGDLDGDTIPEVLVAVMPRGLTLETLNPFGRTRAQLVFYELP